MAEHEDDETQRPEPPATPPAEPEPTAEALAGPAEPRRRLVAAAMAAALVATGAGSFLVGRSLDPPDTALAGPNAPVAATAGDARDIDANNSPTLARNPVDDRNLVVVNRVDTPRFSCAMHVSGDGGATWRRQAIPFPAGAELPERCFAPDADFGPDGTLYVSFVTLAGLGNTPEAAWLVSSDDGGRTLSAPARVLGPLSFQVRLAADPGRVGRLWLSWLQADATATLAFAEPGNPVMAARSDDGGATWSEPVEVSAPERGRVVAPSIAVGRRGEPYVLYLDLGDDRLDYHGGHGGLGGVPYPGHWSLVLARSPDGRMWTEAVVEDAVVPTARIVVLFPPSPSLAVDGRSGAVYVGYTSGRFGDPDVFVWASQDGGASFATGRRVNDTPQADGTSQYLPRLAVAPGGRVDVVYYDRRRDLDDLANEVSLQSSEDGGRTWTPHVRLTDRAFDSRIGFGSERGLPDLGSRLAVVSTARRALVVWSDTRAGDETTGKQVLARAVVAFGDAPAARVVLQVAGLVVAAAGVLVGVRAASRRRTVAPLAK